MQKITYGRGTIEIRNSMVIDFMDGNIKFDDNAVSLPFSNRLYNFLCSENAEGIENYNADNAVDYLIQRTQDKKFQRSLKSFGKYKAYKDRKFPERVDPAQYKDNVRELYYDIIEILKLNLNRTERFFQKVLMHPAFLLKERQEFLYFYFAAHDAGGNEHWVGKARKFEQLISQIDKPLYCRLFSDENFPRFIDALKNFRANKTDFDSLNFISPDKLCTVPDPEFKNFAETVERQRAEKLCSMSDGAFNTYLKRIDSFRYCGRSRLTDASSRCTKVISDASLSIEDEEELILFCLINSEFFSSERKFQTAGTAVAELYDKCKRLVLQKICTSRSLPCSDDFMYSSWEDLQESFPEGISALNKLGQAGILHRICGYLSNGSLKISNVYTLPRDIIQSFPSERELSVALKPDSTNKIGSEAYIKLIAMLCFYYIYGAEKNGYSYPGYEEFLAVTNSKLAECGLNGLYLSPFSNMLVCAAKTDEPIKTLHMYIDRAVHQVLREQKGTNLSTCRNAVLSCFYLDPQVPDSVAVIGEAFTGSNETELIGVWTNTADQLYPIQAALDDIGGCLPPGAEVRILYWESRSEKAVCFAGKTPPEIAPDEAERILNFGFNSDRDPGNSSPCKVSLKSYDKMNEMLIAYSFYASLCNDGAATGAHNLRLSLFDK